MSTALYRRYRPETFADVIGQEHVTEPLMQALRTGRVNHAYLFSGPRGCGKTTSARILARCLNCDQGPTPTPCGTCPSCVALSRGGSGSVDVIEIDAASHGGVDDARDLREKASYGPAQSRYKVYIIDEAHMVTSAGFNALLKIVEEPPEHVKFIFATTEPEKVIGTIRSRTHHYPFRLVPPARLQAYMEQLCTSEGVSVAPGVLSFVTRAGAGSVRDSLSVLDQLIAGSGPEGLTYEGAAALLGFTDGELLDETVTALGVGDASTVFTAIDKVVESGLDPRRFVEDLLERLRDLIVVAAVPDGAGAVLRGLPEDQVERMRGQAAAFGPGALSRAADLVYAGLTEMTGATAPRLQLELIAARVLLPGAAGEQGYAARLDRLERRLDVGGVPSPAAAAPAHAPAPPAPAAPVPAHPTVSPGPPARPPAPEAPAPQPPTGEPTGQQPPVREPAPGQPAPAPGSSAPDGPATRDEAAAGSAPAAASAPAPERPQGTPAARGPGGVDVAVLRRAWPDVLAKVFTMKRTTWTLLSAHAQVVDYDGRVLTLGVATPGLLATLQQGTHTELVRQALIDVLGVDARVEGRLAEGSAPASPPAPPASAGPSASVPTGPSGGARSGGPRPGGGHPAADAGDRFVAVGGAAGGSWGGGATAGDWGSAPPPAATAPAWATEDVPAAPTALATAPEPEVPEEDLVSDDDEPVDHAAESGQSVVERLLGGSVISDEQL